MKKKKNKTITIIGTILLSCSLLLNVYLGLKSGALSYHQLSGSVNETWNKTDVSLEIDSIKSYESDGVRCNSGEPGDYITILDFRYDSLFDEITIGYSLYFNIADDLEAYFVLENSNKERYTTPVEVSHWLVGGDIVYISGNTMREHNLRSSKIVEAWVRTLD